MTFDLKLCLLSVFFTFNVKIIHFVNNKQCNCLGLRFSLVNKIA